MAESPTAWWCPDCHLLFDHDPDADNLLPDHPTHSCWKSSLDGGSELLMGQPGWDNCYAKPELVTLVHHGLSLADLAVLLRDAGYDVHIAGGAYAEDAMRPTLWVAAKEPPPTSNDELRRLAAEVLRQGPPIDPTP